LKKIDFRKEWKIMAKIDKFAKNLDRNDLFWKILAKKDFF